MTPSRRHAPDLLDVNVLVALAWPNHVHHDLAHEWFDHNHRQGWATTPVTESGFVRVSSNRSAIATATTPALAKRLLGEMALLDGHTFLVDDVQGVTGSRADPELLTSHRDVTDAHLLAVAERHEGRLVTLDTGIRRLLGDRDPRLLVVLSPA